MSDEPTTSKLQQLVVAPASSRLGQFFEGILVPWQGLKVLAGRPRLWGYAIVPVLINIAITPAPYHVNGVTL